MQLAVAMSLMDQVAPLRKFFQPPSEALACDWRGKSTSCKRCGVRGRGANQPSNACVLRGEHQPTPATVRDEGAVLQEAGLRDP